MNKKRGFTLTELTVAIAFISILLLTIAAVTMKMVENYHKGLTIKSINTIGLDLIDEFTAAISESPVLDPESLCKSLGDIGTKNDSGQYVGGENGADTCMNDDAKEFYYQQFIEKITVTKNGSSLEKDLPTSGVFCTGKYTYVWNTGYVVSSDTDNHTMSSGFYSGGSGIGDPPYFRLRKYRDTGHNFCRASFPTDEKTGMKNYPKNNDNNKTYDDGDSLKNELKEEALSNELINTADIAIYSLTINSPDINKNTGRSLYTGSFVLGSITGDIDINPEGSNGEFSSCKLEDASKFDVEYCATNKFNFAIRAMGGNSGN